MRAAIPDDALRDFRRGLEEAVRAGDREKSSWASLQAVFVRGYLLNDCASMPEMLRNAQAHVIAAGELPQQLSALYTYQGIALGMQGRHRESADVLQLAVDAQLEADYGEQLKVGTSLGNLSIAWNYLGDHAKARDLASEALRVSLALYGDNHPALLSIYLNLAATESQMNRDFAAHQNAQRAMDICLATAPEPALECVEHGAWVGFLQLKLGRFDQAAKLLETLMAIQHASGKRGSPSTNWIEVDAARVAHRRGYLGQAFELAHEGVRRNADEAHPVNFLASNAHRTLAEILIELAQVEQAERELDQAEALLSSGSQEADTQQRRLTMARTRTAIAKGEFDRALAMIQSIAGTHPDRNLCEQDDCALIMARLFRLRDELGAARPWLDAAAERARASQDAAPHLQIPLLIEEAEFQLAAHEPAAALESFAAAQALFDADQYAPLRRAAIDFGLARSSLLTGGPTARARAIEWARAARDVLVAAPLAPVRLRSDVESWLRRHSGL